MLGSKIKEMSTRATKSGIDRIFDRDRSKFTLLEGRLFRARVGVFVGRQKGKAGPTCR